MFNEVPSPIKITTNAGVLRTQGIGPEMKTGCLHSAWKMVRRPCALGLIGLATAVVLWGLGYKLSLYQQHPTRLACASVAKLSIGPRGPYLATASRLKGRSRLITGSLAHPSRNPQGPQLDFMTFHLPAQTGSVLSPVSFIPARSPPPQRIRFV